MRPSITLPETCDSTWRWIRSPDPVGARELHDLLRHISEEECASWTHGVEWQAFAVARFPWFTSHNWSHELVERVRYLDRWIGGWVVYVGYSDHLRPEDAEPNRIASELYGKPVSGPVFLSEREVQLVIRALQSTHRQVYLADFRRYLDERHQQNGGGG